MMNFERRELLLILTLLSAVCMNEYLYYLIELEAGYGMGESFFVTPGCLCTSSPFVVFLLPGFFYTSQQAVASLLTCLSQWE